MLTNIRNRSSHALTAIILMGTLSFASEKHKSSLPRGDFGFQLGTRLLDVDANAKTRHFERILGTNSSVKVDEWRHFRMPDGHKLQAITMFIRKGKVDQISLVYPDSLRPSFQEIFEELKGRFGDTAGIDDKHLDFPIYKADGRTPSGNIDRVHNQSAYWSDGKTVIALEGRTREHMKELTMDFIDLTDGKRLRFTTIGGGKDFYFHASQPEKGRP